MELVVHAGTREEGAAVGREEGIYGCSDVFDYPGKSSITVRQLGMD